MKKINSNQFKLTIFSSKLSQLRKKLNSLLKSRANYLKIVFDNKSFVKGGLYILNRKCGKKSCKCATTNYRHPSHYLYRSEQSKNNIIYLKAEEVGRLKILTNNYKKFRHARAELKKIEKEMFDLLNKIEQARTLKFNREGNREKKQIQKKAREKKR